MKIELNKVKPSKTLGQMESGSVFWVNGTLHALFQMDSISPTWTLVNLSTNKAICLSLNSPVFKEIVEPVTAKIVMET